MPFDITAQSIFPYSVERTGYNYSTAGVRFHFRRNSISLVASSFYGPTAIFSAMSILSYCIDLDKV